MILKIRILFKTALIIISLLAVFIMNCELLGDNIDALRERARGKIAGILCTECSNEICVCEDDPRTIISNVSVTITPPMKGAIPSDTAVSYEAGYTVEEVRWNPDDNPFLGNTAYTVYVTLAADEDYVFAENLTASVRGYAANVSENLKTSVTISFQFDKTMDNEVIDMIIKSQPNQLTYTHGDLINLSGLEITLLYDDSTSYDIAIEDFGTNIIADPDGSTVLSHVVHNDKPVTVILGSFTANTNNLIVSQIALSIATAVHTKEYDGTTTASGVMLTFDDYINDDDVYADEVIAEYIDANAGTQTINIISITLGGNDAGNYTMSPVSGIIVTGGITKANPIVTWPTNLTGLPGQLLSEVQLPGNGTSIPEGTFAWAEPNTVIGDAGTQISSLIFTPLDTENYNTLTQDVNVFISMIDPIVTWPTNLTAIAGQRLSDVSLPGNGTSDTDGAFSWVTPNALVGDTGTRYHSLMFIPDDTTNYNTITNTECIVTVFDGGFSISFAQIIDNAPQITGPTIHQNSANGPTTAIIMVENPAQYSSIDWFLLGIHRRGDSFALNSRDYDNTGEYRIAVEVFKDGVPYNQTVTFTVAP